MTNDKEMKKILKKKAMENPEKYYPVSLLKEKGFERKKCKKCGTYFWSTDPEREVCDDPQCVGGYKFIGKSPTQKKMDYIDVWKEFSSLFKKLGYEPIKRYPIAARWRDDTDFVQASIYDFQPYVVNGLIKPPANPLVVPQPCVRFNDLDNIGISGRHYSLFTMIGQHAFLPPEEFNQNKYFEDIFTWLTKGIGLKKQDIIYHEDAWAGGGNAGPSMEFFSKGLEIGNQVYMRYDTTSGTFKKLKLNVLDMGMGQERPSWLTHGTSTSYEANFPTVIKKMYKIASFKPNKNIMEKFLPYSGLLNVDEVEDINRKWNEIASKINIDTEELKKNVLKASQIYALSDHTRSLLFALNDGVLPSNTGGGYNLRILARRSIDLINKNQWNTTLYDLAEEHAKYLKPQYPELTENLDVVQNLLEVEEKKYSKHKQEMKSIIKSLKSKKIDRNELITLYDSKGISPEMLKEEGIEVNTPPNFYSLISEIHEGKNKNHKTSTKTRKDIEISEDLPETEILYYQDWKIEKFKAKIIYLKDNFVILDRTAFYPTSGGQEHDQGYITKNSEKYKIKDIFKKEKWIIHELETTEDLKINDSVEGHIDLKTRMQLTQHHTSAHIINLASKRVLGKHIWQAGAEKTTEKARLDITHYELPSFEQIQKIEKEANSIIRKSLDIQKTIMKRDEAESKYGFVIYQGGAVPGEKLRIVKIDEDIEACGGTHLNNTLEANIIKITNVSKIQDGVVRIEYVAGEKALEHIQNLESYLKHSSDLLSVSYKEIPKTIEKFFNELKKQKKENKDILNSMLELIHKNSQNKEIIELNLNIIQKSSTQLANLFTKKHPEKGIIIKNTSLNYIICVLGSKTNNKNAKHLLKNYKDIKGNPKFAIAKIK